MNPYYPRHGGIGFGKGGAGMRRPLSQEYCLNYTVNYRKIEKYDKIAKKRIFIVDYFIAPLRALNSARLRSQIIQHPPPTSDLSLRATGGGKDKLLIFALCKGIIFGERGLFSVDPARHRVL